MKTISILFNVLFSIYLSGINAIKTVPVGVDGYGGRWYQMNSTQLIQNKFERTESCITVDFGLLDDGSFSVAQTSTVGSVQGPFKVLNATAYQTTESGKFNALFAPSTWTDYWVIALGPVVDGLYQWSVATNSFHSNQPVSGHTPLFVLARDPDDYDLLYKTSAENVVADNGLMKHSVAIEQGSQCKYS
jgi:hypothetical protein